jgi:hypothetical protein
MTAVGHLRRAVGPLRGPDERGRGPRARDRCPLRRQRRPQACASAVARADRSSASGRAVTADDGNAQGYGSSVKLKVITPGPGDVAGAGGAFNIDLSLQAQNAAGNELLSAANGYIPFFNDVTAPTFGPGKPDPGAPGLVVTLSTTPAAAGGPNSALVSRFAGRKRLVCDLLDGPARA